ncbi:MAG: hypothetical protein IIZ06_04425, partial [Kiritimatiellae bacterium]|nr:hypothetical protein [Kiritimatiellia bacterium]
MPSATLFLYSAIAHVIIPDFLGFVNALCQLACFHFVSWRVFTLSVGVFSLCQLADKTICATAV